MSEKFVRIMVDRENDFTVAMTEDGTIYAKDGWPEARGWVMKYSIEGSEPPRWRRLENILEEATGESRERAGDGLAG